MKRSALLLAALLTAFPLRARDKKNLIDKTGAALENVKNKITEPIRDPKAAFSTWFDFNPAVERGEKRNYNVLPLFVSSPERGQGFGLKFAHASLCQKHDVLKLQAVETLKNKSAFHLLYELPPELLGRLGGEIELAYENYARFYYGIGNTTQKEEESEYTPEVFQAHVPFLYRLAGPLQAGVALHFDNWKMIETDRLGILPRDLPHLAGREASRIFTPNLLLRYDSRNSKSNPSRGLFVEGQYEYSKKILGSEADFIRMNLEARHFLPLFGRDDHVFGFRLFMDYTNGDVPFYLLPELGGIFFNRGLIEGRFRDNFSLTGNWEYRFKIYQRLHWAFFVDGGNVFGRPGLTRFARTKITGGSGMRYYVPPGNLLLARVDAGYSTEGLQVYLTFDHPF